jgi:hypothetical protein
MTKPSRPKLVRSLALAAAAAMTISLAISQRAEAISPISPGAVPAHAAGGALIQVRGGHGGGGGHGGFHAGAMHGLGGGGWHGGGFRYGGFHPHHGFGHFHHRRFFYGGYYPDYYPYYYYHRCRVIWTSYGPRRICGYRHWHRWHHRRWWHHHRHWW